MLFRQRDLALRDLVLQAQEAFVSRGEPLALPYAAHAATADMDALQSQRLCHAEATMCRVVEAVGEYRGFNLFTDAVGMGTTSPRQTVDQAVCPVGLVVAPDFVELLSGVAHQSAGF